MVMSPAGLETKNDCAIEDQQQFTSHIVWIHLLISELSAREQYLG
jgi:hypothetical protein